MFEDSLLQDIKAAKVQNHWKIFLQIFIFHVTPFFHIGVIQFLSGHCPAFAVLRRNEHKLGLLHVINYIIDFLLTMPFFFLSITYYDIGLYILIPFMLGVIALLHLIDKGKNAVVPFNSTRPTAVEVGPGKYKFTFLDYAVTSIFIGATFAILFCDTSMFPDELSKTSIGGLGTMDLGAGLILFTSGITARQARSTDSLNNSFSR